VKTVRLSPRAADDLENIGDVIAVDDPARALEFVQELRERCAVLADMPECGVERRDLQPGIRMLVHGVYLLFYRVLGDEVRIERVLHGARDVVRHLPAK